MGSNATLNLTIASTLQKAGFTEAAEHMRQMQKELDNTRNKNESLGDSFQKIKSALQDAAIVAFYKASADAAGNAEQAQLLLQVAVENTGVSWAKSKTQINAVNEALANNSRFNKTELDGALGILIERTQSLSVAQANLKTVMGITIGTGRNMADVADQIGRAANGSQRDVMQLAKEFGVTGENAKNADAVLAQLATRFTGLATKTDDYVGISKQLGSAWEKLKETFGNIVGGPIEQMKQGLTYVLKLVTQIVQLFVDLDHASARLMQGNFKNMGEAFKDLDKDLGDLITGKFANLPEALADAGKKTTANAHRLSEELIAMKRQFDDDAAKLDAERGKDAFQQVKADADAQIDQLRRLDAFKIASETEQAKLILAIRRDQAAKERQIDEQTAKDRMQTAITIGHAIGVATGKMLMGEQNAWKDAAASIIDVIVQVGETAVLTSSVQAYWKEIGLYGWAGVVSGLPLLAKGAAAAAGIAALGELAKGALGSGSAVSAPSGGGGGDGGSSPAPAAGGGSDTATTAATPRGLTNLRIVVMGDMVNDNSYIDRLAAKITSAVEDRDVRLISTSSQRG